MGSMQTLSETDRRLLAQWAASCAERVVPLFEADDDSQRMIQNALAQTRAYSNGESTSAAEIAKRFMAGRAANAATTAAGVAAGRAVGQAAAVAHMGAHALGAAAYAVKALSLAYPDRPELVQEEIHWQLEQLTDDQRLALRRLPALGTDRSGPLGPGLLSRGILGSVIRDLQKHLESPE